MSQQPPYGQPPQPGWGPPPAPKKSSAGKIIGFGCLGIVGLVVVLGVAGTLLGNNTSDKSPKSPVTASSAGSTAPSAPAKARTSTAAAPEPKGAEADVKITACEVDSATNWAKAELTITNHSSKTSNYLVSVEFVNASGTRLGEAFAATNNLAAGQAAEQTAQGLDQITGKITCKLTKVTRYAS